MIPACGVAMDTSLLYLDGIRLPTHFQGTSAQAHQLAMSLTKISIAEETWHLRKSGITIGLGELIPKMSPLVTHLNHLNFSGT